MSERSDSENQDCDTESTESRERPLNQGVDDVGEARAVLGVASWPRDIPGMSRGHVAYGVASRV